MIKPDRFHPADYDSLPWDISCHTLARQNIFLRPKSKSATKHIQNRDLGLILGANGSKLRYLSVRATFRPKTKTLRIGRPGGQNARTLRASHLEPISAS